MQSDVYQSTCVGVKWEWNVNQIPSNLLEPRVIYLAATCRCLWLTASCYQVKNTPLRSRSTSLHLVGLVNVGMYILLENGMCSCMDTVCAIATSSVCAVVVEERVAYVTTSKVLRGQMWKYIWILLPLIRPWINQFLESMQVKLSYVWLTL
jgi:hypothetical protein